jgi:acetoin utilization protein AcuB
MEHAMFVKLWMKKDIISISPDQTLAEAKSLMEQNKIRQVLVLNGPTLAGIISKEDIQKGIPASDDENTRLLAAQGRVGAYMNQNPITANPMDPLEDIALTMRRNKIGAIPILEENILVGIITESDIFRAMTEILGAGQDGARVELKIGHGSKDLFQIVKLCKQFDVSITAISIYHDFSPEHQLLTLRLDGDEIDTLIEALWESGCQINRIMRFNEETTAGE